MGAFNRDKNEQNTNPLYFYSAFLCKATSFQHPEVVKNKKHEPHWQMGKPRLKEYEVYLIVTWPIS